MAQDALKPGEQVKPEEMPKLSDVAQEVKQGYIAEIHQALLKNESEDPETKGPKHSCILPSTDFQFKKASEMSLKDVNFKLMPTAKSVSFLFLISSFIFML